MRSLLSFRMGALLIAGVFCLPATTASAARSRGARHVVSVSDDFPIHRSWPTVLDRRPGTVIRVAPTTFLPLSTWSAAPAAPPRDDSTMWSDAESLDPNEDWTETVFDVNDPGSRIVMGIDGQVALDWAEVVFADGSTQVVDFKERTAASGSYSLVDFNDIRQVDHVRVMALALSPQAAITLRLAK